MGFKNTVCVPKISHGKLFELFTASINMILKADIIFFIMRNYLA